MPRVSDDYRRARRDEIAQAAIRCLERKGVHDTSIADIVEESGLSTGAIYSHFTSKSELARYIVAEYLFPRLHELEHSTEVRTPRDVLETMLQGLHRRRPAHPDRRAVLGRGGDRAASCATR